MLLQSLYFSRFLPNRPRPLSSFDTHARWQPVTQSARSRRSYGKIEDCEQSTRTQRKLTQVTISTRAYRTTSRWHCHYRILWLFKLKAIFFWDPILDVAVEIQPRALLPLNAITGCDSTSFICKHSKKTVRLHFVFPLPWTSLNVLRADTIAPADRFVCPLCMTD